MINLTQSVSYDAVKKKHFEKDSRDFLKALARKLELPDYKIEYNKGGIAVSGDTTLMAMFDNDKGIYITISTPSTHGIMFRTIKHMKDFTGGPNNWFNPSSFSSYGEVARHIKRCLNVV